MAPSLLVVVARELGVDVADGLQPRRGIQRAGGEADRPAAGRLPEEARAALRTESAAGVRLALGAVDPAQRALLGDADVLTRRLACRPDVARPAPALAAVAHHHVARRAVHLEADGPA